MQNVVTNSVEVDADNSDGKLVPYLTAYAHLRRVTFPVAIPGNHYCTQFSGANRSCPFGETTRAFALVVAIRDTHALSDIDPKASRWYKKEYFGCRKA